MNTYFFYRCMDYTIFFLLLISWIQNVRHFLGGSTSIFWFALRTLFWNFDMFALCAGVLTSVYSVLNFLIIENICSSFMISSKRVHT